MPTTPGALRDRPQAPPVPGTLTRDRTGHARLGAGDPASRTGLLALGARSIAVAALVVRVLVIVLVDPHVPALGDASAYHLLANHLADGRGYIRPFDLVKFHLVVPTAEYPPLHPFVALALRPRSGCAASRPSGSASRSSAAGTVALVGLLGRRDRRHRGRARGRRASPRSRRCCSSPRRR